MIEVRRTIQPDALIDNINCILQPVQQSIVIAHIPFAMPVREPSRQ